MLKKLSIILVVDLVVIWLWVSCMHLDPSVAIYLIFCIPFCFTINLIAGFILKAVNNPWANSIFLNSIISSVIFYYIFTHDIQSGVDGSYRNMYFQKSNHAYNIMFNLSNGQFYDSSEYEFYKLDNGGSSTIGVRGRYYMRNDTIVLFMDSGKVMKIFNHTLSDYPEKGDTLNLRDRR